MALLTAGLKSYASVYPANLLFNYVLMLAPVAYWRQALT